MTDERKRREWRTVTEKEFEDWTRPKLILFLSADIENSTRLKQSAVKSADWLPKVFSFISEFPATFQYCREVRAREAKLVPPGPLAPWKILGDEVIFAIPIFDHSQPEWETMSMAGALAKWNEERDVKVKGTAWLAGFPVANTPIPVPNSEGRPKADYIGPLMDAGFRLAKASTARRFVLSVELAWWLLDPTLSGKPDIRFRGCWPHKGLAEETGYPLIWLNIHPPKFHEQEDHLLGRKADNFEQTLRELCENFILEFGVPSHVPFLHGDEDGGPPSPEFSAQLEDAKELLRKILFVEEGEAGDPCLEITDDLGQALQSKLRNLGTEPLRE